MSDPRGCQLAIGDDGAEDHRILHGKAGWPRLDHRTLVLSLVDIVVLPDRNGRDSQDKNSSGRNATVLLTVAPGVVDSITSCVAGRVHSLSDDTSEVDGAGVGS